LDSLVYSGITGLRVALVFSDITRGAISHCRISSSLSFAPTLSSGPLALPLPATEWHMEHFCAA
jgi:hypothetical protein